VKTIYNKTLLVTAAAVILVSCKPELDVPAAGKGSMDVTKYIAIGNSISAGYADNALYYDGQMVSYPNLLARQFQLIGGGEFNQPLVPASSLGVGASMNAKLVLAPSTDCMGVTSLAPQFAAQNGDLTIFATSVAAQGPFNNLSVPGLKATTVVYPGYGDYTKGTGNYNPFFTRMVADPQSASVLSEAVAQNPTFFSLFIGSDDVMGYAISGGAADAITPSSGPAGFGFDASVDAIVNTMIANGAKGVIAGLPTLEAMPYFNTVPFNGLLLDEANANALTAAYSPLGMTFQPGPNAFVIEDANAPGGMRKITQDEHILLSIPQDSLKCAGWGSMKAIPNQYVLTVDELTQINNAITAYNAKLKSLADANGLAYVDVNAFMSHAKTGMMFNGVAMNTQFVTGGIFSLDGIHLTPLGNALLANEFIKSINSKYGSTIPKINATNFKGIMFP
jgi:hypothetical protein